MPSPVVTGFKQSETFAAGTTDTPFSSVTISDTSPGDIIHVAIGEQDPFGNFPAIYYSSDTTGILSGAGLDATDAAAGYYYLDGTAAAVTAELQGLVFTPANPTPQAPVPTNFNLSVLDTNDATQGVSPTGVAFQGPSSSIGEHVVEDRAVPPPPPSPNGTVVADGSSAVITDANGNAWQLTGPNGVNGYGVAVNGAAIPQDYGVTQIGVFSGTVWQATAANNWTEATLGGLSVIDTTTGTDLGNGQTSGAAQVSVSPYSGPVTGLTGQCATITHDSLNIAATTPDWFIAGGSGNDGMSVLSGNNVLDGGGGSNFLTGGTGTDSFYLDDRSPPATVWSTIANFHSGDNAAIWGVTPQDFSVTWLDGQGAAGFTGLTAVFSAPGKPLAGITLTGFTSADLTNGRLDVSYGRTPDLPGLPGSTYMHIGAN